MAYVTIPKDLTKVKTKVMFGLTKRQLICQGVKLPTCRGFPVCCIPKEELIHGDMIAGHEFKEDLEAWMLSLVFNIGKITRRNIHFVAHLVSGLLASLPRLFDSCPKGLKIVFLYWSFCHIHSPSYILLFIFLSGYVYTVPVMSQNNS